MTEIDVLRFMADVLFGKRDAAPTYFDWFA